jgi:inner membrane protein
MIPGPRALVDRARTRSTAGRRRTLDSLTQAALGAAIGEAVLGRHIGRRAALWGAALGTLPDLDVLVPLGDPVADFTYHRSASHSLIVLSVLAPALAYGLSRIPRTRDADFPRWWLMVFLVLITHPLLDAFTVYGTQLLWPLDATPATWSTLFIIDPAFTLPLIGGLAITALLATRRGPDRPRPWLPNVVGLALAVTYLGWSVAAKRMIDADVRASLEAQGVPWTRFVTTPAPFTTLLWRVVVMEPTRYHEAFDSLVDGDDHLHLVPHASAPSLLHGIEQHWPVERLAWFTKGFYAVTLADGAVVMTDLRMGVEPSYVFRFAVGRRTDEGTTVPVPARQLSSTYDADRLGWLWERIWRSDVDLAP